ncbi:MAG: Wzz/FepE/Etk N-terminal domain-containing protein [Micromonosporaceae bacterium]
MSQEALDLRRSLQLVRRHKIIFGIFVALGLFGGAAFVVLRPPMFESQALVVVHVPNAEGASAQGGPAVSGPTSPLATQIVIAESDPVLASALRSVHPPMSLQTLRGRVQAESPTNNVLSISAQGKTTAEAESAANAVANSYAAYVNSGNVPGGQVQARVLGPATTVAGKSLYTRLLVTGVLGALLGALLGAIVVLAFSHRDRRLRERNDIADSIGVPVLASIDVERPSDAAGWTKLFTDYRPGAVDAWRLRKALQYLGLADANLAGFREGSGFSLGVLTFSSDHGALALGPQFAVFAASLGIPTALVVGPQQDMHATATLRTACAPPSSALSGQSGHLRLAVRDHDSADRQSDAVLTVVVAVVDGQAPQIADTMRTNATVLGVTAGAATAEQLARVATAVAAHGRQIAGILVADPDPDDPTTGRLPQLARPAQRRRPTRVTGTTMETRQ